MMVRTAARNGMGRTTDCPSISLHQINHRQFVRRRASSLGMTTTPFGISLHCTSYSQAIALSALSPTGEAATSFAHALLCETGTRARWHHRPPARLSVHLSVRPSTRGSGSARSSSRARRMALMLVSLAYIYSRCKKRPRGG